MKPMMPGRHCCCAFVLSITEMKCTENNGYICDHRYPPVGICRLSHSSLQICTLSFCTYMRISPFSYMVAAPIKRQQQAYSSSAPSSVSSGTAGELVRLLCEEPDSYTSCQDTDSITYNGKPYSMSACRTLPLQLFHLHGRLCG